MMIMRGASSLLVLATLVKEASAACSVDTHHPENGGYYVAGINGLDNSAERSANGMRAADMMWAKGMDYHHGQLAACEGIFCPTPNPPVPQYIFAHTCAHIRFEYAADSGSTVWELPDQAALDACDFTNAELKGAADAGAPYYEYKIEGDHVIGDVLYFASKEGCTEGQKAAVQIGEDYTATYGQCYDMGSSLSMGASRIKNCDCDFHLRPSTNTNPCHQGFHDGCMADMPDDTSCCPGDDASYDSATRSYINGGTCLGKAAKAKHEANAEKLKRMHTCGPTATAKLDATESCPSSFSMSYDGGLCAMHKTVRECEVASPPASCATDHAWRIYEAAATPECTATVACPEGTRRQK